VRTRKVYREYRGSLDGSLVEPPRPRPLYQRLTPLGWISIAGLSVLLLTGIASVTSLVTARAPNANAIVQQVSQPTPQAIKPVDVVVVQAPNAIATTQPVPQPAAQIITPAVPKQVTTEPRATGQPTAQPVASAQLAPSKQPASGRQQSWMTTLLTRPVAVAVIPSAVMIFGAVIASLVWKRRDYA
jgi:hypothetical protein